MEDILNIVNEFPSYYNADANRVKELLEILKGLGYIGVKYNDGQKVCITSTEKGVLYLESITEKRCEIDYKKLFFTVFVGGVLGGVFSGFIVNFILAILGV